MHTRPLRSQATLRVVAALAAGLVLASSVSLAGAAHADDSAPVTWSVQPADESGPDGRPWIEATLDPGQSAVDHLAIHNLSDHEVDFSLAAADGFFNENGRFNILPAGRKSVDAGTWIDIQESVTVGAGETVVLPFTVTVPTNAQPGDHAAGVAASIQAASADESGATVGVESRVGFRVMTRVTGELRAQAVVENLTTSYRTAWNPFAPGGATVGFDVRNTGNTRLSVTGSVEAGGATVAFPPADEPQELLAGDLRHFSVSIPAVWPLIAVAAHIVVEPKAIVVDDEAPAMDAISLSATVWAFPWPQLLVLLGIALIMAAILWTRMRSRVRLAGMLEAARMEGARSVTEKGEGEARE